jgi:ABC-type amino acid transport substrate-binding protein
VRDSLAQNRNDPLYRSGARELAAPEHAELEGLDSLARAKALGKLVACADPYNYPYSDQNAEPPGFDIEIFRAIAKRAGLHAEIFWVDTGTRGGLGRAFRNSIAKKACDFFLGLSTGGDDEEVSENRLAFTTPYLGMGYVLVVQGKADAITSLEELHKTKIKIGVSMSTPMDDYLFTHGYDRELYFQNRRVFEGMAKGEIDAAMVWSTALGQARREFPNLKAHMVPGYVPEPGLRWNAAMAVPTKETAMKQFLDESIGQLLNDGEMKRIVESYGVPFYPPFH